MPDPSSSLAAVALADGDAEPRQRFSEVLSGLAARTSPAISIGDVLNAFGVNRLENIDPCHNERNLLRMRNKHEQHRGYSRRRL